MLIYFHVNNFQVENSDDIVSMATGIMHMLGHVIGLEHDGSEGGNSKSRMEWNICLIIYVLGWIYKWMAIKLF